MTAVKHGIFGVVAHGGQSADKIAEVCDLDCYATKKLLRALEGAGYLLRGNNNYELTQEQWNVYERGQRSHAALMAKEVAWRLPVSRKATALLDVGGGHGLYSIELCRRHPRLYATILDLPGAFPTASSLSS